MTMHAAELFCEPVPDDIEGYYKMIKSPMDLGTVCSNLKDGIYPNIAEALQNISLVWANCRKFNEPSSYIVKQCAVTQKAFERKWLEAGLPLQ